jgi:hypothetical protein
MKLIVDGTPHELTTGDSFYLASNIPHGVETMEETQVLDTFSPPREDYLAIDEKARKREGRVRRIEGRLGEPSLPQKSVALNQPP